MSENTAKKCQPKYENLVSQSVFARMCGIKRQSVSAAVRKLTLFTSGKSKKIDLDNPTNGAYLKKCQYRNRVRAADDEKIEACEAEGIKTNPLPTPVHKGRQKEASPSFDPVGQAHVEDMATRKIRAGVEQAELKLAEARGKLVSRKDVELVFGQIHSVDVQEFHTLAQRVGPLIAAACGIEDPEKLIKINTILEAEIFKSLEHIKSHIDKFLEDHKER
jgi:hypothetical protein